MDFCSIQNCDMTTINALLRVYAQSTADICRKQYLGRYGSEEAAWAALKQDYAGFIKDFIHQDDRFIFALRENDDFTAALRIIQTAPDGWYIEALETAPEWRGKGCATLLLKNTIRCMRTLGARSIASVVKAENAASRAAHEACGFTDTGKTAKDAEGNVIKNCLIYQYHFSG